MKSIRHSFKATFGILFSVLTIATSVLGLLLFQSNLASNLASQGVEHSRDVIEQADETAVAFRTVQQESIAIFVKGDTSLNRSYSNARARMLESVEKLDRLSADNTIQQETVAKLRRALLDLAAYTDLPLTGSETFTRQTIARRIDRNAQLRIEAQAIVDKFRRNEVQRLEERQKEHAESAQRLNALFAALISGVLAVIGVTFLTVRYSFNKRIETENALIKAKELFFSLFHESPVGLAISRPEDGALIDCNLVYASLVNYSREELIGQAPAQLGIIRDSPKESGDFEIQVFPKDRAPMWALFSVQPIHLQDQDCLLSAMIDVSSRKEAEETTQRALERERELNKMKSNFVTLASHEFRTPLTTVLSSTYLLENYITGEHKEKVSKHTGRIRSSVNTLTTILDEFLSLTKIEEGRMQPRIEVVNIPELISSVCASLNTYLKQGQGIRCEHTGNTEANTDPGILTNVLLNLLSNSIKYSPEGAGIFVRSSVNGALEISVRDTGIGIPQADQEMLFNRFYRASNAGNAQGTGLGLHLTRHYVELLTGKISFTSKIGEGTEFRLAFNK